MAYTPANGLNINGNFVTEGVYAPAHGLNINGNFSNVIPAPKRALILQGNSLIPIPEAFIGTGKSPLVLLDYIIKVRNTTEGVPLVLADDGFNLRTLRQTEQLIL